MSGWTYDPRASRALAPWYSVISVVPATEPVERVSHRSDGIGPHTIGRPLPAAGRRLEVQGPLEFNHRVPSLRNILNACAFRIGGAEGDRTPDLVNAIPFWFGFVRTSSHFIGRKI
jgi:hypothetical protein